MPKVINFNCIDISKKAVGELNREVFGYNLLLDPQAHQGIAVCKSEQNATRDGYIVNCPLTSDQVEPGKNYSHFIDSVQDGHALDFRLFYVAGLVDIFIEKRRDPKGKLGAAAVTECLRPLGDEFSDAEIARIESFAERIGLDYGEFDVLRDQPTGRLFIVDVAKTPYRLSPKLSRKEKVRIGEYLTVAYLDRIVRPIFERFCDET